MKISNKNNSKTLKHPKGSILAEALVAVTTLIAGVVAVSTIINNAVSATAISKDYLVAENLVNEGAESIKIIRDTNIMKWPQFIDLCWLVKNPKANNLPGPNGAGCQQEWPIAGTNYLTRGDGGHWKLVPSGAREELNLGVNVNAQAPYRLYLKSFGISPNNYSEYLHDPNSSVASKFYRSVQATSVQPGSANFEIKVQWLDGSKVREIIRNQIIYNDI